MEAWVYNPKEGDQRLPHKYTPNQPISNTHLKELGVLHWRINVDNLDDKPTLQQLKDQQGYIYTEEITVAPGVLENYEQKTKQFFREHMHPYEESRLILEGSGYWDIRDYNNNWIRFNVCKGDMVTLPPGMYHRFTVDTNNYIKALLLFKSVPQRIELFRPDGDETLARKTYVSNILKNVNGMSSLHLESNHRPLTKHYH